MDDDKKICPLTKSNCYREDCGFWSNRDRKCAVPVIGTMLMAVDNDVYELRKSIIHLMEKVIR